MSPKPTFELLLGYFIFSGTSGLEAHAARHKTRIWFATPPASYRTPALEFTKTAAETAGETAGETQGAGGRAGELLRRLPLLRAKGGPAGSLRSSFPSPPPSTPSFSGSFPSSLHSNFGEFPYAPPTCQPLFETPDTLQEFQYGTLYM